MTKAIAKKKVKPVKKKMPLKKLLDPKEQQLTEKQIKKGIAALDEKADARYDYAKLILDHQSAAVKSVVEAMVEKMKHMAGEPVFYFQGVRINPPDEKWARRVQEKTFYWIAARLLVALALWDIQTEDFKLPTKLCAKCGEKP